MRRSLIISCLCAASALVAAGPASAQVSLSPSSWGFGSQPVGTETAPKLFTLSNGPFGGPYNTDPFAIEPFRVVSEDCPSTLLNDANCTIGVVFAPKTTGHQTGELQGNSTTAQPDANLTGTGSAAASAKGKKCKRGKKSASAAKKKGCKKKKKKR